MWLATPRGWCLIGRLWLERGVAGRSVLLSEAFRWAVCERESRYLALRTPIHTHTVCVHVCEVRGKDERTKGRTERRGRREDTERSPRDRARLSREKQARGPAPSTVQYDGRPSPVLPWLFVPLIYVCTISLTKRMDYLVAVD